MSCRAVCLTVWVALLCLSSPAVADEALRPVKPWVLDYAEAQCLASRDYATSDGPVTLAFRPAPNGATYEIFVLRKSRSPMFAEELEGSVDFGRGAIKAWLLHYRIDTNKLDAYQFRITALEMAQARNASSVTLHIKSGINYSFSLESMPDLLNGLDACTADLKRYWNMEGSEVASIAVPSKGDIRSIFKADDYPWEAQVRSQQGTVQFLLLIDEAGKVAACHVLIPSNVPVIDAMGCIVIRERADFRAARDRDGKAVRSTIVTPPIVWRLM
jgi:hypothetical protein